MLMLEASVGLGNGTVTRSGSKKGSCGAYFGTKNRCTKLINRPWKWRDTGASNGYRWTL